MLKLERVHVGLSRFTIDAELKRRGYRIEEAIEEGDRVLRLIRPDGTIAVCARKPLEEGPSHERR